MVEETVSQLSRARGVKVEGRPHLDLRAVWTAPHAHWALVVAAVGRRGRGGVRRELGLFYSLLAPQQQNDNHGDEAEEEDQTCQAH